MNNLQWPGYLERYYDIIMPTDPPRQDSRAELHYRIGGAYAQFFNVSVSVASTM